MLYLLVASLRTFLPLNPHPIERSPALKIPLWIFLIIGALYFCAVRVDIMDIDASQYAEISREMSISGDYLHVYDRGMDYLDKPSPTPTHQSGSVLRVAKGSLPDVA